MVLEPLTIEGFLGGSKLPLTVANGIEGNDVGVADWRHSSKRRRRVDWLKGEDGDW
jgi:hypothetical protein